MIYRGYLIQAQVATWTTYEVKDDGTLGSYLGEGGGDIDYPTYEVWENGELNGDLLIDGLITLENAKRFIDDEITRLTTFQSEEGN